MCNLPRPGIEPVSPALASRFLTTGPPGKSFVYVCVCVSSSVVSDSLRPHGLYPTRLLCPWVSPGKNTEKAFNVSLITTMSSIILSVQMRLHVNYELEDLFSNFLILVSTNYCLESVWRVPGLSLLFSLQIHSIWILISVMDQNFLPVLKPLFLFTFILFLSIYLHHDSWDILSNFTLTTIALVGTSLIRSLDYLVTLPQGSLLQCFEANLTCIPRWIPLNGNSAYAVTWC